MQDTAIGIVGEIDMIEAHRAALNDQWRRVGHVHDLGLAIDQAEHRLHIDQPLADRAIDHAQQVQRAEELRQ